VCYKGVQLTVFYCQYKSSNSKSLVLVHIITICCYKSSRSLAYVDCWLGCHRKDGR